MLIIVFMPMKNNTLVVGVIIQNLIRFQSEILFVLYMTVRTLSIVSPLVIIEPDILLISYLKSDKNSAMLCNFICYLFFYDSGQLTLLSGCFNNK